MKKSKLKQIIMECIREVILEEVDSDLYDAQTKMIDHTPSKLKDAIETGIYDGFDWGNTNPEIKRSLSISNIVIEDGKKIKKYLGKYLLHYTTDPVDRQKSVKAIGWMPTGTTSTYTNINIDARNVEGLSILLSKDFVLRT